MDREEPGQEGARGSQEEGAGSADGHPGGLSVALSHMERGCGIQSGGECEEPDDYLPVEEAVLAMPSPTSSGGDVPAGALEEESEMVGDASGKGGGSVMGTPGSYAPTTPCSDGSGANVRREEDAAEYSPDIWRLLTEPLTPTSRTSQRRQAYYEENMEEETTTTDPTERGEDGWQEDWSSRSS